MARVPPTDDELYAALRGLTRDLNLVWIDPRLVIAGHVDLYEAVRQFSHAAGIAWIDPRTGVRYEPPEEP